LESRFNVWTNHSLLSYTTTGSLACCDVLMHAQTTACTPTLVVSINSSWVNTRQPARPRPRNKCPQGIWRERRDRDMSENRKAEHVRHVHLCRHANLNESKVIQGHTESKEHVGADTIEFQLLLHDSLSSRNSLFIHSSLHSSSSSFLGLGGFCP